MNKYNENLSKILWDLDEFIQREGINMNKPLLRSKLTLIHKLLLKGSREKTIVRGTLNRLGKLCPELLLMKTFDILDFLRTKNKTTSFTRKINIRRIENPVTLLSFFEDENFPLKIEYPEDQ